MPAAADPGIQIAEPQTPVALDGQGADLRPVQPDRRRHQNVTSKPISSPSEPFSVATSANSLIPSRTMSFRTMSVGGLVAPRSKSDSHFRVWPIMPAAFF